MSFDPWGAWRSAAAFWAPTGAAPGLVASAGAAAAQPPSFAEFTERFQSAVRAFVSAAGAAAPGVPGTPGAQPAEAFTHFLREQFAQLRLPWSFDAGGLAPGAGAGAGAGGGAAGWSLGAGREHQERLQRLNAAGARLMAAHQRLELLWSDALREAAAAYAQQLAAARPQEASPDALQGLYDRWIDAAEEAYGRMAHSESYCDAFAEYVNAGSQWRNELLAGLEQWAKQLDLPTRSEINSLEQRVRDLEQAQRPDRPAREEATRASETASTGAAHRSRRARRRTPP